MPRVEAYHVGGAHGAGRMTPFRTLCRLGIGRCVRLCGIPGGNDGDQHREFLGRHIALDDAQNRRGCLGDFVGWDVALLSWGVHSGMFPCFFGGSVSRFVRSRRSAFTISARVWRGWITASM